MMMQHLAAVRVPDHAPRLDEVVAAHEVMDRDNAADLVVVRDTRAASKGNEVDH
jgi:hypothetical protein